jgi:hypothetical protein
MENREKETLKQAILQSVGEEIDKWLDKQQGITTGYEYESELLKTARNVNKIILEKTVGRLPGSRNEKKSPHLPGKNRNP